MITRNGLVWKFQRRWEKIPLSYYLRHAITEVAVRFDLAYGKDYKWWIDADILEARLTFIRESKEHQAAIDALPKQIQTDTIADNTGEIIDG